jgi:hypothetical protein
MQIEFAQRREAQEVGERSKIKGEQESFLQQK